MRLLLAFMAKSRLLRLTRASLAYTLNLVEFVNLYATPERRRTVKANISKIEVQQGNRWMALLSLGAPSG